MTEDLIPHASLMRKKAQENKTKINNSEAEKFIKNKVLPAILAESERGNPSIHIRLECLADFITVACIRLRERGYKTCTSEDDHDGSCTLTIAWD